MEPGHQRRVGPRANLQVDVGARRDLATSRIDDDELQSAAPCFGERSRAVVDREARDVAALHRNQRIRTDEHPHVGVLEPLHPPGPGSESSVRDDLRGLIDRDRRELLV